MGEYLQRLARYRVNFAVTALKGMVHLTQDMASDDDVGPPE